MERGEIKAHWEKWAREYGTSLRATTKATSAKRLELDALERAFNTALTGNPRASSVLEVGSGNAENLLYLCEKFPQMRFTGIDFVAEMLTSARTRRAERGVPDRRLRLLQGDILELPAELEKTYDIILSNRCIINLRTDDEQKEALSSLCGLIPYGGHLVMIENNSRTYANQNHARELVGLEPRQPEEFNHFINEDLILSHLRGSCAMTVVTVEDFISLHDIVLYVLIPAVNGGVVDYDHPLVKAATDLSIGVSGEQPSAFGNFGQGRLYICRRAG